MNPEHHFEEEKLDRHIEETLRLDAERLRARLAASVPNERLTASLAMKVGSRGLLASFGKRAAMYAGAAVVTAGIYYFLPRNHAELPNHPSTSAPASPTQALPIPPKEIAPAPTAIAAPSHAITPALKLKSSHRGALKLDENSTGTIPTYTDSNYKAPIK